MMNYTKKTNAELIKIINKLEKKLDSDKKAIKMLEEKIEKLEKIVENVVKEHNELLEVSGNGEKWSNYLLVENEKKHCQLYKNLFEGQETKNADLEKQKEELLKRLNQANSTIKELKNEPKATNENELVRELKAREEGYLSIIASFKRESSITPIQESKHKPIENIENKTKKAGRPALYDLDFCQQFIFSNKSKSLREIKALLEEQNQKISTETIRKIKSKKLDWQQQKIVK